MRQKIIVMIAVMSGLFLVALDQTIIATALGQIVSEFASFSSLGFVVTAYLLTSTVTLPIAGKLSDIFGRRLVLLVGVALFGIASLLSGSSQNIEQLIAYRALQGIGGGILTANAFTIIGDLFTPRQRGKWQGLIAAVFGSASVIGPLLGGFLTDGQSVFGVTTDWRWTFWINVPIAIISFGLIAKYCPPIKHQLRAPIDYAGAALLALLLATIVIAVDNTEVIFEGLIDGGVSLTAIRLVLAIVGCVLLAGFIVAERRAQSPIIPLSFFANRTFTTVMVYALLNGAAFLGSILYLTQFNQQVFGAGATEAGLMLLPFILGLGATSALGGQLVSRTGHYKWPLVAGSFIASVSIALLSLLTPESMYWQEAIMMFFAGVGLGFGLPIVTLAVQNEFSQRDLGAATASSQLMRSLGSTVGTAIFGGILTGGLALSLANVDQDPYIQSLRQVPQASQLLGSGSIDTNTALNLNTSDIKSAVRAGAADAPLSPAQRSFVQEQIQQQQDAYSQRVVHAFADNLRPVFWIAGGLMFLATIIAAVGVKERPLRDSHTDSPGVVA